MALLSFEEALTRVLAGVLPLEAVTVPLSEAYGYRLAQEVYSKVQLPPFDNSQMDGFAIRYNDFSQTELGSCPLITIQFTSAAGHGSVTPLDNGHAARIFTGAAVPANADTIVPNEDVQVSDDSQAVTILQHFAKGQFVRHEGEDVRNGDLLLSAGHLLGPGEVALLAATGHSSALVHRRARVALLINGDELVNPKQGATLKPGQIFESNGLMLEALIRESGAELVGTFFANDSREDLRKQFIEMTLRNAPDVIISTGGVSVGDRDYIRGIVEELGSIIFWRAAIRPGKPIVYGKVGDAHFLGLPGNPASTMVTFELFAKPLLSLLQGGSGIVPTFQTTLTKSISHEPGRRSFVRASTKVVDGVLQSETAGAQGSHFLTSLAFANSLLEISEDVARFEVGNKCRCRLLRSLSVD